MLWVIDPIDGTGDYLNPNVADSERTSCIGIALFKFGVLELSVVYNPFRRQLFVASASQRLATLNSQPLNIEEALRHPFFDTPRYDYCYWDDAPIRVLRLKLMMGVPPIGNESAIGQACDVARGQSYFAVFPGNTLHDIAPGTLLVKMAGGIVTDCQRNPLDWNDLKAGVIYAANPVVHRRVVRYLNT